MMEKPLGAQLPIDVKNRALNVLCIAGFVPFAGFDAD